MKNNIIMNTITMYDGDMSGIVEVSREGATYFLKSFPREKINDIKDGLVGIYILTSNNYVYVGQSMDIKSRVKNHDENKDFWEKVIVLSTTDNSFESTRISYLEEKFISIIKEKSSKKVLNGTSGNKYNISTGIQAALERSVETFVNLIEVVDRTLIEKNLNLEQNNKENLLDSFDNQSSKTHWMLPLSPKFYLIENAFSELGYVELMLLDWKVKVGDYIYFYISSPIRELQYKCEVSDIAILGKNKTDDSKFYVYPQDYEKPLDEELFVRIKLIFKFKNGVTAKELEDNGIKGTIQGKRKINSSLVKFIENKLK
jgi:hypothetical protein